MKSFLVIIMVVAGTLCSHRSSAQGTAYTPLEVLTNGPGRITPLYGGQMLEVWKTYSMVAVPEPGFSFHSWEWLDVFVRKTRITNSTGTISTNIEKTVSSKGRFFTSPELLFVARPIFEMVHSEGFSTVSMYGWQANFGPVRESVEPDVYQTVPGSTAVERGDRLWNGPRTVPFSATVTFDFDATPPSLTAVIPNAVLEGGEPFPLTVRSYSAYQLANGAYSFSGDYLQDINPTGSQYGFDWEFSAPTNGRLVWNGTVGWQGGHIWTLSVSNLTLVQQPHLSITRLGSTAIRVSWATNFSEHVLEYAPSLPAADWSTVTDPVETSGNRHSVTLGIEASQRFYRLRQP